MDEHRYYGVSVKVQRAPRAEGEDRFTPERLQALWDGLAEDFWITLEADAKEALGVDEVFAEGRSGGWAVPYPNIDPEEEPERFERFRELCESNRSHFVSLWPATVSAELANIEREAQQKAEWAARDVVTT